MSSQEVEGEFAQDGEVLRCVILAAAGGIFAKGDIEDPVELVLDGPMGSGDIEHVLGGDEGRQEEPAPAVRFGLADGFAAALDHGDGGKAREVDAAGGYHDGAAAFMAIVRGERGPGSRRGRIGTCDERLGGGEQGRPIGLQRQRIVGTGGQDRARRIGAAVECIGGDDAT